MGWFTGSSSRHHSHTTSTRPGYTRSHAGSTHSSSSRHHSSTSHYKRRPRDGYIQYLYHKLRHLFAQLMHYAKKHPFKIFFMVIMPLVSGGVLHKLAKQFGVTLPEMPGGGGKRGDGYYGSEGYGDGGDLMGKVGGLQGVASGIGGLASMAKMAQAFM